MQTENIQLQICQAEKEKKELLSQLHDFNGGCSIQYGMKISALYTQIIDKNCMLRDLHEQKGKDREKSKMSPLEVCLAIVFGISLIVLIFSK